MGRWTTARVAAVVVAVAAGACAPAAESPSAVPSTPAPTAAPDAGPVLAAFEREHAATIGANELSVVEYLGMTFDLQSSMLPGVDIAGSTRSTGREYAERMAPEGAAVPLPDGVVDSASTAEVRGGSDATLVTYELVTDAPPSEVERVYEERALEEGWRVARDAVPPSDAGVEATWTLAQGSISALVLAARSEEFEVTVLRVLVVTG